MAGRVSRQLIEREWHQRQWRWRIGFLGGLIAGFFLTVYTFWGGRTIFMGGPLSFNHAGIERVCGNCHHPFDGVEDGRCAFPCHSGNKPATAAVIPYWDGIHYVKGRFQYPNCLKCHPAQCHSVSADQREELAAGEGEIRVACEPKIVDNLVLPIPLTLDTCKSCHADGCTRSTHCLDCHREHAEGMPLPINRSDEIFPGKFAFSKELLQIMESDHRVESVEVRRILTLAEVKARGEEFAAGVNEVVSNMPSDNCLACHPDVLTRRAPTFKQTRKSIVPRTAFSHNIRGHRRRCGSCHRQSWLTELDPEESIFSMEACSTCHCPDDCTECHKFHDRAQAPDGHVDIPLRLQYMLEAAKAATPENTATPENSIDQ